MPIIAVFPILSFIGFLLILRTSFAFSSREAVLFSFVILGALILGMTELLGALHLLDLQTLFCSWLIVLLGTLLVLIRKNIFREVRFSFGKKVGQTKFSEKIILISILIIVVLTGVTAFFCPPNTYDSLTYHMARIAHWVQNKTVDYYPTHILRQLVSPPWMEYAALHFQILSKGDYFANSIQWFSMIGSLVGVSLIARELGASFFGQIISVLFAATIPMGIIQASSLQGDYAVALWIVCAFYVLLSRELSWFKVVIFSLSVGLALLTKGTGIVFAVPLLGGFLVRTRVNWLKVGLCLIIIFALTGGYLFRNYQLSSKAVSVAAEGLGVSVEWRDISWSTVMANTFRNIGVHLGTSSDQINKKTEKLLYDGCKLFGGEINDPKATFGDYRFSVTKPSRNENFAVNGWHLILYIFCLLWMLFAFRDRKILIYILTVLGMFLGLIVFVRWQPWISRFHLPLFVLFAPLAGCVCERIKPRFIAVFIAVAFFLFAVPYSINAHPRHLIGKKTFFKKDRMENVFMENRELMSMYSSALKRVESQGCKDIGLVMGEDSWDYPFYLMFNPGQKQTIRLEHVLVHNLAQNLKYPLGDFSPCAILGFSGAEELKWGGKTFGFSYQSADVKVFTAK